MWNSGAARWAAIVDGEDVNGIGRVDAVAADRVENSDGVHVLDARDLVAHSNAYFTAFSLRREYYEVRREKREN